MSTELTMAWQFCWTLTGRSWTWETAFWVKIVAQRIPRDQGRPNGINYSLTLHRLNGKRIMGYDNAHSVRHNGSPAKSCSAKYDHRHRHEKITTYDYSDAQSLLIDFWDDVNLIFKEEGVS